MQFWFRLYIGSRVSAVIIGLFSFWKILNMIDRDTLVVAIFGNYCSFWNDFLGMWGWGDPSYIDFQFYHSIFMCWFTFRFNFIFLDIWIIMSLSHFDWTDWNDCSIFCSQWNLSGHPEKKRKMCHKDPIIILCLLANGNIHAACFFRGYYLRGILVSLHGFITFMLVAFLFQILQATWK